MYLRLFQNDPNNAENLGLDLREDLYLKRLEKYQTELYSKGQASLEVAKGEEEWLREMITAGYPMPFTEKDGVKSYMTLPEYQKMFREMALSGKIKNFDVSGVGFNPQNAGTSNENWMTTSSSGSYKAGTQVTSIVADDAAINGRSKAIWDKITTGVNKSFNTIGGNSYVGLTRGYDPKTPFADIGFVPTQSATGGVNPEGGTAMDLVLGSALQQYATTTADPTSRVSIIVSPEEVSDFDSFDIEAGPDLDEDDNIIANKIFMSLQNEKTKGEFTITYYPNLGANSIDGVKRNSMGNNYLNLEGELYANFHSFRRSLGMKPGEQFTEESLKKRIEEKKLNYDSFKQNYSDESLLEALNTVADVDQKSKGKLQFDFLKSSAPNDSYEMNA